MVLGRMPRTATRRIAAETRRRDARISAAERVDGARVSPHARRGASGGCAIECRRNRAAGRAPVAACSPQPLARGHRSHGRGRHK